MAYKQPVKVGEKHSVTIENYGAKGDGIAKIKGFVLVIPRAKIEQTYNIEIERVFEKWALAKIVE